MPILARRAGEGNHRGPALLGCGGQPLNVSIENTGSNCLNYGDDFIDWQRADATGWTSIPQHDAISDVLHYLQPGDTKRIEALSGAGALGGAIDHSILPGPRG